MPIDWSQMGDIAPQTGAIDWATIDKVTPTPVNAAAQVANDAISQGARAFANQPSDALGGLSQNALDFLAATGHNLVKPLHGAAQLVENAVAKGAAAIPDNAVSRAIVNANNSDNAAQQQWEQQYQSQVPNNPASYAGAVTGSVLPLLASGLTRGLQAAGDYAASKLPDALTRLSPSLLPKMVSGGAQGAIVGGAMAPVDNGADYWTQKGKQTAVGTAVGTVVPMVGSAVQGVWNAAAPFVNPNNVVSQALSRMGVSPGALNAEQLVPGSLPTTAQAAANPQIVAVEKTLANNPAYKGQFEARNIANNDARWSVINNLAQTPDALTAAIQARRGEAQPLIDSLLNNGTPVPAQPILSQLQDLAKSPLGMRPGISGAANDIAAQINANLSQDAAGNGTIGPAHLDAIRQNVKDYLAKYAPNGAVSTQQQAAFEPVRNAIVDAIEGANPGYRDYLAKYSALSQPINTMEAAQSIVGNLDNRAANAGGSPQLTLGGINTELRKVGDTQYGISADGQKALQALQADLQRASISSGLRSPGSDTAYNLQAPNWLGSLLYGKNFQGSGALSMLGRGIGIVGGTIAGGPAGGLGGYVAGKALGNSVSGAASKRVNDVLAEALLNPEVARSLLTQANAGPSAMTQGLLARLPQASLLMGSPSQAIPLSLLSAP